MENDKQESIYLVYVHINKINNKKYVWQTSLEPQRRWRNGDGYKKNKHFYLAIQKYGWDNFEHIILQDNLTLDEANELEEQYIILYNTLDEEYGYNLRHGGSNGALTEETKAKISQSHIGLKISEETRAKMSNSRKSVKNGFYGKHHSEEQKAKWRASRKGKYCGELNHMYGVIRSQEDKDEIMIKSPNKIPVVCIETGIIYYSGRQVERMLKISRKGIAKCCKREQQTAGGYHWRYATEEEIINKLDVVPLEFEGYNYI